MDKNKVSVFICGHKFNLITEDSEKYVTDIAQKVDTKINSLLSSSNLSKEKCAVMAALDFCDDEAKARKSMTDVKEQIKDYIEDSAKLRDEITRLKAQIEKLESEKAEILNSKKTIIASSVETKSEKPQVSADDDLSFDIEVEKETPPVPATTPAVPAPVAPPVAQNPIYPAPAPKQEKKRHNHNHVNPYKERFMQQKQEAKGYTPTRQYTLFDNKDE